MSDKVLPENHFALAALYAAAMDKPKQVRKRYADIMRKLLELDIDMRKEERRQDEAD